MNNEQNMNVIDSSVFVGLINSDDAHHQKAIDLLKDADVKEILLFDYIYIEVMNVLKRKTTLELCEKFTEFLKYWNIEVAMKEFEEIKIANLVFNQKNNLSFEDCLLIAGANRRNADIITFDKELEKAWNKVKK